MASAKSSSIAFWDKAATSKMLALRNRMHLATKGVLDGWNPEDLRLALQRFAHEVREQGGDDHDLYFVTKYQARQLLQKAREGLAKDLSATRLSEYAKFIGRLEEMYKRAIAAGNDRMALEVTKIQIDLSNSLHGLAIGEQNSRGKNGISGTLDAAIEGLTKALAGRDTPSCREDEMRTSEHEAGPSV